MSAIRVCYMQYCLCYVLTINYTGIIYTVFTVGLVRSQKKRFNIASFITGALAGLSLLLINTI